MTLPTIVIAKEFSETPAGRHLEDGPRTGQLFRESVLLPLLATHDVILIDLDGTLGYGSSFLEEAFGGLVRHGIPETELRRRIQIKSERKFYADRIWHYVAEAAAEIKKKA